MIIEEEYQYKATSDSFGNPLKGSKNYKLHLPPDIPVKNFWSVIVYDIKTNLIIGTDQPWPSISRKSKNLVINQDGSVDVWFGPHVSSNKETNWIKTIPGKGWFLILRLYDPLQSWFDKTWRPREIEEVH